MRRYEKLNVVLDNLSSRGSVMGTTWPAYPGCNVVDHLLSLIVNKLKVSVKGLQRLDLYNTRLCFMSAFPLTVTHVLNLHFFMLPCYPQVPYFQRAEVHTHTNTHRRV